MAPIKMLMTWGSLVSINTSHSSKCQNDLGMIGMTP